MSGSPSSSVQRHRVVIVSGSSGGNDAELNRLRAIAEYESRSQTWRTVLSAHLDEAELARLQELFRIATEFGASVRVEPIDTDALRAAIMDSTSMTLSLDRIAHLGK